MRESTAASWNPDLDICLTLKACADATELPSPDLAVGGGFLKLFVLDELSYGLSFRLFVLLQFGYGVEDVACNGMSGRGADVRGRSKVEEWTR